ARPMRAPLAGRRRLADGERMAPPRWEACAGLARPGAVWFGESLPEQAWQSAWQEVQECDLLLSVGTAGAVYPAAQLPQLALEQGAVVVDVNPDPVTVSSERELSLVGKAGEILPRLLEGL